jgi:hypothetical protein
MNSRFALLVPVALLALGTACGEPRYLGWDYARAYVECFTMQADLTRPSVAGSEYHLSGNEAAAIRILVQEATTDQETAEGEDRE